MKKVLLTLILLFFVSTISFAQFEVGKSHAGPSIAIGFGGWGLGFGADYEYGMSLKDIGVEAPGKLGVGAIARYYSFDLGAYGTSSWSYTNIIIGAQGNYHFNLENNKIDPWVGLVLGFNIASTSYDGPNASWVDSFVADSYGGLFFNFNAGVRYWFSPTMAARVGFGGGNIVSSLILGVDFKF